MHKNPFLNLILVLSFCFSAPILKAESVDEKFTQISPKHTPGTGEYVHGQGYGKILIRIMVFGAIPQQGIHYVPEGTDLLFSILYSGGYTEKTKLNGITIRRRGIADLIEVDLESIIEEGRPIPKLVDGDIVNIPFNWKKDYEEFALLTGIFSSVTALILSVVALSR